MSLLRSGLQLIMNFKLTQYVEKLITAESSHVSVLISWLWGVQVVY